MNANPAFFAELKRRNVLRAAVLYAGAVWLLAQVITQLGPVFEAPTWIARAFLIVAAIGFPFWIAFAWFYEFTPQGFRRDSEVAADSRVRHSNARKLDFAIIGVLAVAVVLLASGYFIRRNAPAGAAPIVPAKSIAVLPFQNLSNDENNEYFVEGMQDLILTKLADIGGLKVIARTSTAKYTSHPDDLKTIGQQLGVATILEGSVQKQGNQVLINLQLIDTKTDGHIWAQAYTRTLDNVFGVEGEVAQKVAAALKAKLSLAESARLASDLSSNNAANDLFLQAEYQTNQGFAHYDTTSMKAAIPLYRQVIAEAPDFALAHARLSYTESMLAWEGGGGMDVKQLITDARSNARQALELAPNQPDPYFALGYSDYFGDESGHRDYAGALQAFAKALALRPNDANTLAARGIVERRQGRFDAAIASLQQAVALDPRNASLVSELGTTYRLAARYPDAERCLQRALALDPQNFKAKHFLSSTILDSSGDIPRALAALAGSDPRLKLRRVDLLTYQRKYKEALTLLDGVPDTPDVFSPGVGSGPKALRQARLYRLMGDMARARPLYARALPEIRAQLSHSQSIRQATVWQNLAKAELGLGHAVQGLEAIAKAQAIGDDSDDRVFGPELKADSAALYVEAGRPDLAMPLLTKALAVPGGGSQYALVLLWLDPAWDPVRHDPRFQALLQEYAKYKPAVIPAPFAPAKGDSR